MMNYKIKIILFLGMLVSAIASADDSIKLSIQRDDFRLSIVTRDQLSSLTNESVVLVDTTWLVRARETLPKFERMGVFKQFKIKATNEISLSMIMEEILKEGREDRFGSFFKRPTTSIKILKQKKVYMFYAYEAINSELELTAGDIVVFQDLGDI